MLYFLQITSKVAAGSPLASRSSAEGEGPRNHALRGDTGARSPLGAPQPRLRVTPYMSEDKSKKRVKSKENHRGAGYTTYTTTTTKLFQATVAGTDPHSEALVVGQTGRTPAHVAENRRGERRAETQQAGRGMERENGVMKIPEKTRIWNRHTSCEQPSARSWEERIKLIQMALNQNRTNSALKYGCSRSSHMQEEEEKKKKRKRKKKKKKGQHVWCQGPQTKPRSSFPSTVPQRASASSRLCRPPRISGFKPPRATFQTADSSLLMLDQSVRANRSSS
ncbi:hypothetical protein EYF80_026723 [Liparis tanakae]|uniref:Uncharacterized protein n=1 Tax=Liparis tanakae TaxID=230148 RepID=A0A4Z2HB30_9TELE|nr:hypothetical protein EYF80_026723 [Liparis tanakae]